MTLTPALGTCVQHHLCQIAKEIRRTHTPPKSLIHYPVRNRKESKVLKCLLVLLCFRSILAVNSLVSV